MWPNPQFPIDLVTFTEEILNGKLYFLYSVLALLWTISGKSSITDVWQGPKYASWLNLCLQFQLLQNISNKFSFPNSIIDRLTSRFQLIGFQFTKTNQIVKVSDFVQRIL